MAWSTLPTYTDGNVLTAAHVLAIRDNINETAPAKFTASGQVFVSTGPNAGAARAPAGAEYTGGGADSTNSNTYIPMGGGPVVTLTTGTKAIVWHGASLTSDSAGSRAFSTVEVLSGGTTTVAPSDTNAVWRDTEATATRSVKCSVVVFLSSLTAGSNSFAHRGRSSSTGAIATMVPRNLVVFPL